MKTYQDIGELYRDKMLGATPTPPDGLWESIQANTKVKPSHSWHYIIAAAAAVIIAVGLWLLLKPATDTPAIACPATPTNTTTATAVTTDNESAAPMACNQPATTCGTAATSATALAPATEHTPIMASGHDNHTTTTPATTGDSYVSSTATTITRTPAPTPLKETTTTSAQPARQVITPTTFSHDTTIYSGSTIALYVHNATNVQWNTGATAYSIKVSPSYDEEYEVSFTNHMHHDTNITIHVHCVEPIEVFVPNAFTPNGDGLNDLFEIKASQEPAYYTIDITNAARQKVFSSNSLHVQWDGTFRGQDMPHGVYYYIITYKDHMNKTHTLKGDILLIRQ